MSVFKVTLTNQFGGPIVNPSQGQANARATGQGNMDEVAQSTGTSIQRTAYIMGPNKVNRKLIDGATFTDVNFWKRYCATPVGPLTVDSAILTLVTDDGSYWVDGGSTSFPRFYTVSVGAASSYTTAGQTVDVIGDNGGPAVFATITNTGASTITYQINGLSTAQATLAYGASVTYSPGELSISKLQFKSATGTSTVTVQLGVLSVPLS